MATERTSTDELLDENGCAPDADRSEPAEESIPAARVRAQVQHAARAGELVADLAIDQLLADDRLRTDGGEVQRAESIACASCDDFSIEKSYAGATGTEGERHYEESVEIPDECPVCGGELDGTDGGVDGGEPRGE